MQTASLSVPSNYVNYVSSLIDEKILNNQKIADLGSSLFNAPQDESTELIQETVVLLSHKLAQENQADVLRNVPGFKTWVTAKMYCSDEAIAQYAKSVLTNLKILPNAKSVLTKLKILPIGNPTEILLRHIFRELCVNSTKNEIDFLLSECKKEEKNKFLLQKVAEKVASTVWPIIAVPVTIYASLFILKSVNVFADYAKEKYLPILINNAPVAIVCVATKIYNWSFTIFMTALGARFTRLNNYKFISIPAKIIVKFSLWTILWKIHLCLRLFSFTIETAYKSYSEIRNTIKRTIHLRKEGSNLIGSLRVACELQQAEHLWISQVMRLKVKAE